MFKRGYSKMGKRKKFPTLAEIIESHGWKKEYERFLPLSRFIFRPIGFLVTYLAIRIGLTTELAAWLSGLAGISGCILLTTNQSSFIIIGILLLLIFNLLDCVDGSIARTTKTENPYGKFLDSVIGDIINFIFFLFVGIIIFRDPNLAIFHKSGFQIDHLIWLFLGFATAISTAILQNMECIYQAQLKEDWIVFIRKGSPTSESVSEKNGNKNILHVARLIDRNFRVRETHYFFLIITYWQNLADIYLLFFFLYYLVHISLTFMIFSYRAKKLRNSFFR